MNKICTVKLIYSNSFLFQKHDTLEGRVHWNVFTVDQPQHMRANGSDKNE
jgi:hypothetical protein